MARDERQRASDGRQKASDGRQKASDDRQKASDDRQKAHDERQRASDGRPMASDERQKASDERHVAKDQRVVNSLTYLLVTRHSSRATRSWLCCKSRRSRRMRVAQRFSAGNQGSNGTESAQRTTEGTTSCLWFSAGREADCEFTCPVPALKRWAIGIQSASRT